MDEVFCTRISREYMCCFCTSGFDVDKSSSHIEAFLVGTVMARAKHFHKEYIWRAPKDNTVQALVLYCDKLDIGVRSIVDIM